MTKKATAADKRRMAAIKASGCVCCLLVSWKTRAPDVHHITAGGRRQSHQHTIGLCPYHHRGVMPWEKMSKQLTLGMLGPSLAHGKMTFQEFFGTEVSLLYVQNLLLAAFAHYGWAGYTVPLNVRREAIELWLKIRD